MNNKKKFFFVLIYIALTISFIILLEFLLRSFSFGINTDLFLEKEINGEKYYLLNTKFINKYFLGVSNRIKVEDKVLFRKDKDKKTVRGFLIGESTSEGFPYYSNNDFGKMAEKTLTEANFLNNLEIHNVSFAAMSSYYVYDVAKKILKYDPDFIVIYSGHNEYYGTLGSISGSNHILKRLYLILKEIKIFQFLIGIVENRKNNFGNESLMEKMYDNRIVEPDDKINKITLKNFMANIEDVVKIYSSKGIPVIMIEPVSNIFSMPPFKGYDERLESNFLNKYLEIVVKSNNNAENYNFYFQNKDKYNYDPLKRYLDGLSKYKIGDNSYMEDLKFAKDNDRIPFRAKSELIESLRELYKNRKIKKYNSFFYITLEDKLKERNSFFGNDIFSDHLHFNNYGHISVSFFLGEKISQIFFAQQFEEKEYIFNEFYNKKLINSMIFFNPLNEILAYKRLDSLFSLSLFKNMKIKYFTTLKEDIESNEIYKDKELITYLSTNSDNLDLYNIYIRVIEYYLDKMDYGKADYLSESMRILLPGYYYSYFIAGYLSSLKKEKDRSDLFFRFCYDLSDHDIILFNSIKKIYMAFYGEDEFKKFKNSLAIPIYKNKTDINNPLEILKKLFLLKKENNIKDLNNYFYDLIYLKDDNTLFSTVDYVMQNLDHYIIDPAKIKNISLVKANSFLVDKYFEKLKIYEKDDYLRDLINNKRYKDLKFYFKEKSIIIFVKYKGQWKILF